MDHTGDKAGYKQANHEKKAVFWGKIGWPQCPKTANVPNISWPLLGGLACIFLSNFGDHGGSVGIYRGVKMAKNRAKLHVLG